MTEKEIEDLKLENKRYGNKYLEWHQKSLKLIDENSGLCEMVEKLKSKIDKQRRESEDKSKRREKLLDKQNDEIKAKEEDLKYKKRLIAEQDKVIKNLFKDDVKFESYKNWISFECKYIQAEEE